MSAPTPPVARSAVDGTGVEPGTLSRTTADAHACATEPLRLIELSREAERTGDHRDGVDLAEAALGAGSMRRIDRARCLDLLALHHLRLGSFESSVERGLQAIELLADGTDAATLARTHCTLALAFHETGLHEKSVPHVVSAMAAARASGDATAEFWALSRSGMVHEDAGNMPRAIEVNRQALLMARTVEDPDVLFAGLNNLANSLVTLAQALRDGGAADSLRAAASLEEARELFIGALEIAVHHGHTSREALALGNLVGVLTSVGRFDDARALAARAKELTHAHGYRSLELTSDINLAQVTRAEGRTAEAAAAMEALLELPEVADEPLLLTELHSALHQMHKELGRYESALSHHERLYAVRMGLAAQTAGIQSRILLSSLEIEEAHHRAEHSQREADRAEARAEELERAAHTDMLTGLPNRRALDRDLPVLVRQELAAGHEPSAAMVDLDHSKEVNDVHGHAMGDRVLVVMAEVLRQATRENDLVIRIGGEEFLLVFADTTPEQAVHACERLLGAVHAHPWGEVVAGLTCTVSVGVAVLDPSEGITRWLERADAALYTAKGLGRDRVVAADRA